MGGERKNQQGAVERGNGPKKLENKKNSPSKGPKAKVKKKRCPRS